MNYATTIQEAHAVATAAMQVAYDAFIALINKPGNELLKERTERICGKACLEPAYCGFAWVIIPRKDNPDAIKALKMASTGAAGQDRTYGSATGYASKGQCSATDWQVWAPGSYSGQSMEIKEVGAIAFAAHLNANGFVGARTYTRGD